MSCRYEYQGKVKGRVDRTSTDNVEKPTVSILWIRTSSTVESGSRLLLNVSACLPCTRRHIQKDNNLHIHYRRNLKSGIKFFGMKMS
jgi:hypothetical protein